MSHNVGPSSSLGEVSDQLISDPTGIPCLQLIAGPTLDILQGWNAFPPELCCSQQPRSQGLLVSASTKLFPAQPWVSSCALAHQKLLALSTAPGFWAAYAQPSRCLSPVCLPKQALLKDQITQLLTPDQLHSSSASSHRTRGICRQPWGSAPIPFTRATYS